jgi:hypothetical protein
MKAKDYDFSRLLGALIVSFDVGLYMRYHINEAFEFKGLRATPSKYVAPSGGISPLAPKELGQTRRESIRVIMPHLLCPLSNYL